MKAVVYRQGKLAVDTLPDLIPGPGQILVRTLACGICGSDLHFCHHAADFVDLAARSGAHSLAPRLDRDIVLGHEYCAEIVEFGPHTKRTLRPGAVVCSPPVALTATGPLAIGYSNQFPGGFAEYMLLTEDLAVPVPNGIDPAVASLTEPIAVGWHAVKLADLSTGTPAVVLGCGPVGLAVIASLRQLNAGPIVASDFSAFRRQLAEKIGADVTVDPAVQSPFEEWQKIARAGARTAAPSGKSCVIFECVGLPGILAQAMEGAPNDAELVVVGACMQADHIEPMMGMFKALTIKFSKTYSLREFSDVLYMIAENKMDVSSLITKSIGLDEIPDAFATLEIPQEQVKIIVDPRS